MTLAMVAKRVIWADIMAEAAERKRQKAKRQTSNRRRRP